MTPAAPRGAATSEPDRHGEDDASWPERERELRRAALVLRLETARAAGRAGVPVRARRG